jgi:Dolichyl-phosphate-mannose-protein mannosyltransferase
LLAAMGVQLMGGALADSATSDEPIHILSGYILLTQRHVLFDPEHPFPFKALSALPLLLLRPQLPSAVTQLSAAQAATRYDTYPLANAASFTMLFGAGSHGRLLLLLPRLVMIVVTLLFALAMFLWTRSLFGNASGLIVLALVAFDPSFLAHGHLVNDDVAAALALVVALAAFDLFLRAPSRRSLAFAAAGFGAALMTKFSLLLLGPAYVLLVALWLWRDRRATTLPPIFRRLSRRWMRYVAGLIVVLGTGWLTIWLFYGALILINPAQNQVFPDPIGNRFLDLADHVFPAQYDKGIAGVAHPRVGYLFGACFSGSKIDYFPVLALFKIPLPTLIMIGIGLAWVAIDHRRAGFTGAVLLLPPALFLSASGFAGVDIGFRHALPFYAPMLIAAAAPASRLAEMRRASLRRALAPGVAAIGLLLWLCVDSARAAPYYLPYFNELAGEPRAIPYIASDSNVDWGQATRALADYVRAHGIAEVAFANFGGYAEATALGLPHVLADPGNRGYVGYLAISRTAMVIDQCRGGANWGWVVNTRRPVAVIAGAINLYSLP